ncbi:MAG TPA: peptidylprolyl isomerase [Gammaproteobacteria bacterium]|nr:peptidylprolyl isomerase [Gammaproteobacteria bacterium]
MRTVYSLILIALLGGVLAACKQGGGSAGNPVLATVNGSPITDGALRALERQRNNGQEMQLNDVQRQAAVKLLVNMQLLSEEAEKNGLDKTQDVQDDLAINRSTVLAQLDAQDFVNKHAPTDADIKNAYDQRVKGMDMHQYKARHILVASEDQAKDIIAQLNKGASFAALAKKDSMDTGSANNGGELGDWFSASSMVPEFGAALAGLKKGEYTKQPVKSQYGWHVILLEDERTQPTPTLEQLHDQIVDELKRKAFDDHLDQLRTAAKVDVKNTAPASASAPAPAKP